jgi:hypothetical protein
MTLIDYHARAELFLGSDQQTALEQGSRTFRTAALALHFAFEHAAPVSLRGARLEVGEQSYGPGELYAFYRSAEYPLPRRQEVEPRRKRRMPFYGASFAKAA